MRILKSPLWPPVCGDVPAVGGLMMNGSTLLCIFFRSPTIQVSFNFWRMQNLGFAFAMLPLIRHRKGDQIRVAAFLSSHLQMFNTHPYPASPVIGAVVRIEEEGRTPEAVDLKKALMGPYAAIGDSFFWGALRSFSAVEMACRLRDFLPEIPARAAALGLLILFSLGVHKGISSVKILYGMTLLCMVISF